jgi:hypothetical protein
MTTNRLFLRACLVTTLSSAACTTLQSSDLKTSGISAHMQVTADGSGATNVSATFNVDNNSTDYVDLTAGDTAAATVAGQTRTMSRSSTFGIISYETSFTGQDADGTLYTIALNRMSDVSAPSSTCTLPKPFNITAPTANTTASRAADLLVTYDAPGTQDTMSWQASGSCIQGILGGNVAGDSGSFTIAKNSLLPVAPSSAASTCQMQITLTRQRPGQLDTHFGGGGAILASQQRTVTFNTAP